MFLNAMWLFHRMDSTLVDFTDMKWQRGDLTFIFNGDARGNLLQQHFSHWIYVNNFFAALCARDAKLRVHLIDLIWE